MRVGYGSPEGQGGGISQDQMEKAAPPLRSRGAVRRRGGLGLTAQAWALEPAWSPRICCSGAQASGSVWDERGGGRPLGVAAGTQLCVWVQCPQDPPPVLLLLRKWLPGLLGAGGSQPQSSLNLAQTQGSQTWPRDGRIRPAEASWLGPCVF